MSRGLQLTNERNSFCVLSFDATHSACSIRYVDAGLKTIFLCWLYDSIATKVIKLMLIRWLSDPIRERRLRANESPQYWEKKHLKTSLEPCTFWKQNLSVLTFLSFWPLLTKPTPTQQWSGIISYLCFDTFFEFLIVLFVLDKLFYVLGRTLGFLIPIQNTIMAPPR